MQLEEEKKLTALSALYRDAECSSGISAGPDTLLRPPCGSALCSLGGFHGSRRLWPGSVLAQQAHHGLLISPLSRHLHRHSYVAIPRCI